MGKLVYGVGISDAGYTIQKMELGTNKFDGRQTWKVVWVCPFYAKWKAMLNRCYSLSYKKKQPTYINCYACDEWLTFSNFKSWMEQQDWEGKQLDKDILDPNNKVYSSKTCVFVSRMVNNFVTERGALRGEWPIGVCWHKVTNRFMAYCGNPFTGRREYLGLFTCPQEAHQAWL